MKKIHLIAALLLCCWGFSGCVSFIDTNKMTLNTTNKPGQILNLKYAGDSNKALAAKAEHMVNNGFLNNQEEAYGYYDVRYEVTTQSGNFRNFMLYIPILWVAPVLGIPTGVSQFNLTAHFYIFDSDGNAVKHYSNTRTYRQPFGLFYNNGFATKKGGKEFSKLFDEIFANSASDSAIINQALQQAGSISKNANIASVQSNIDRFFRENPFARNSK